MIGKQYIGVRAKIVERGLRDGAGADQPSGIEHRDNPLQAHQQA